MNPRLRVALTALPVLSLGILSWLPLLWMALSGPHPRPARRYGALAAYSGVGTAVVVAMVVFADDTGNEPAQAFGGCLLLAHIAAATVIIWRLTGETLAPAKDPYA